MVTGEMFITLQPCEKNCVRPIIQHERYRHRSDDESRHADDQYLLRAAVELIQGFATGQIEDAHSVPIAGAQAQLAVDTLVNLRNKALESYTEIMRINL